MTQFYHRDDASSVEYIDAIPRYDKTAKQKRMWRYIGMGVAAIVVIVVVVVVAVVVTDHKKNSGSASTSGNNQYPVSAYANMTEIVTNNSTQLQNKQRIFVIGDIHGCLSEFNALVEEINYNSNTDQLILAGDIMSKGPDSVGVVRRAKELGALCVRGNHDDKIIRFKTFENAKGKNAMYPLDATLPEGNVPDPLEFKNYHAALAVNMTESDYEYLDSCPVILHLPFLNNSVIVHAGLDPNIPLLQDQIPYLVMNMRDIDSNNNPTPESGVGTQWSTKWNSAQSQLTVNNTNIYYGHDAGRGLNLKDYTFGLDSGCVYGDKLTAIEMKTHALKQVQCAKYASNTDD